MKTAVIRDLAQIRAQIEEFLKSAREPALLEPGEELLPLTAENYALEMRGSRLTLQAWDRTRNWSRRLTAITEATNARLAMTVERFARREGQMFLLDLGRRSGAELGKRTGRLVFRERFRLFLRRQLRPLPLYQRRRPAARRTARLRQSRCPPRTLPPPRAQHRRTLAADRRSPRRGAHSQTRWTHQPARARHRVRRTLRPRPPLRTRRTPARACASCARNRPPRRRARSRALGRRRYRAPALPPVSRGVVGISGARPNRNPRCHAAPRPHLRTGARICRGRARHPRSAGGGSHRPAHRGGVEGQRRSAPSAPGARLLDPCQMAPGRPRVFRQRLLSRHRTAPRCAAPLAGLALARISPHHGDHIELFRTWH